MLSCNFHPQLQRINVQGNLFCWGSAWSALVVVAVWSWERTGSGMPSWASGSSKSWVSISDMFGSPKSLRSCPCTSCLLKVARKAKQPPYQPQDSGPAKTTRFFDPWGWELVTSAWIGMINSLSNELLSSLLLLWYLSSRPSVGLLVSFKHCFKSHLEALQAITRFPPSQNLVTKAKIIHRIARDQTSAFRRDMSVVK